MTHTEKEKQTVQRIFQEIQQTQQGLLTSSQAPLASWSYQFIQHPNNFPIVNYKRVFFWHCESLEICRMLYVLIFQKEQEGSDKHFDIKRTEGYLCVYC